MRISRVAAVVVARRDVFPTFVSSALDVGGARRAQQLAT